MTSRFQASKDTAYEYLNKKAFDWGYVPHSDVAAQTRCFTYLEETIAQLEAKILRSRETPGAAQAAQDSLGLPQHPILGLELDSSEDGEILKSLKVTLLSNYNLLKPNYGSYSMRNSKMFWSYWDKIRETAVKVQEGFGATQQQIDEKINQLEVGRYVSVDFSKENN